MIETCLEKIGFEVLLEQKAADLFAICDQEDKGFVTKRDMQRLRNEVYCSCAYSVGLLYGIFRFIKEFFNHIIGSNHRHLLTINNENVMFYLTLRNLTACFSSVRSLINIPFFASPLISAKKQFYSKFSKSHLLLYVPRSEDRRAGHMQSYSVGFRRFMQQILGSFLRIWFEKLFKKSRYNIIDW